MTGDVTLDPVEVLGELGLYARRITERIAAEDRATVTSRDPGRLADMTMSDRARVLGVALDRWAERVTDAPCPDSRQAANTAMALIDAQLAELHTTRARLVGEIRRDDDANNARVDALLAARRNRNGATT